MSATLRSYACHCRGFPVRDLHFDHLCLDITPSPYPYMRSCGGSSGLRSDYGRAAGGVQDMDVDMDVRSSSSAGMERAMAAATVGAGCSMVAAQLLSSSPSLHPDLWGSSADTSGLAGDIPRHA